MKVIEPGFKILTHTSYNGRDELGYIEDVARTCYKSEDKISFDGTSSRKMVRSLISSSHDAMIEHSILSIKFICDRGISHELVRHRTMSFAQESTRYCNYSKGQFGGEITVIRPFWVDVGTVGYEMWYSACEDAERSYFDLLGYGWTPQEARSVLPHSLKTEVVVTGNYRSWRHFFELRACDKTGPAHPQMKQIAIPALLEVKRRIPIAFDDLEPAAGSYTCINYGSDGEI